MMTEHVCPYKGKGSFAAYDNESLHWHNQRCGEHGWLCKRCEQDRADARLERQLKRTEQLRDDIEEMQATVKEQISRMLEHL